MKEQIPGTDGTKQLTKEGIQMHLKHWREDVTSLTANKIRIKIPT